jgi:hypothetical protein
MSAPGFFVRLPEHFGLRHAEDIGRKDAVWRAVALSAHHDATARRNNSDARTRRNDANPRPRRNDGRTRSGASSAAHTAHATRLGFGRLDAYRRGYGRGGNRREEQCTHGDASLLDRCRTDRASGLKRDANPSDA